MRTLNTKRHLLLTISALLVFLDQSGLVELRHELEISTTHTTTSQGDRCGAQVRGGRLAVREAEFPCQVTSLTSDQMILRPQEEIAGVVGPVFVTCRNCTVTLMGVEPCDRRHDYLIPYQGSCSIGGVTTIQATLTLVTMVTLMLMLALRYVWFRYRWAPVGYRLHGSVGGFSQFTQIYESATKRNALELIPLAERRVAEPVSQRTYRRVDITRPRLIAIVALLVLSPSLFMPSHCQFLVHGNEGQVVVADDSNVYIEEGHYSCPLSLLYYTAPWDIVLNSQYWCTWAGCDSNGPCDSYSARGNWTTTTLWKYNSSETTAWAFRRHCDQPGPNCPFIDGCWKWDERLKVDLSSKHSVFSVGDCVPHLKVTVSGNYTNRLTYFGLEPGLNKQRYVLVETAGGIWLRCNGEGNQGHPQPNEVGDLQINQDSEFALSEAADACVVSETRGPRCSYFQSFSKALLKNCATLTDVTEKEMLTVVGGHLRATWPQAIKLIFEHQPNVSHTMNPGNCTIVRRYITGAVMGSMGVKMCLFLVSHDLKSTVNFSHKCLEEPITVGCNMAMQCFDIPSYTNCWKDDREAGVHVISHEDVAKYHLQDLRWGTGDPVLKPSSPFGFWNWATKYMLGHSVLGGAIVFGIAIIVLKR